MGVWWAAAQPSIMTPVAGTRGGIPGCDQALGVGIVAFDLRICELTYRIRAAFDCSKSEKLPEYHEWPWASNLVAPH